MTAAALALAALTPPARAAAPPRVAGTTVLTASRDAVTVVRVPRAASLTIDAGAHSPAVEVSSGAGRVAGFTVTALRRPREGSPMTLMALRMGLCERAGCRATAPRRAYEYVHATRDLPTQDLERGRRVTLPAGDYAVRSVTDGAPVRLTLRLEGLSGTARIAVTTPNRLTLRTDSSRDGVAGVNPLREVGVTHTFRGDLGFMLHVALSDYEPHARNRLGVCYYRDRTSPTGHFHPGCPEAEYELATEATVPTVHYYGSDYGSAITLVPGEWTLGFYMTGVGGKSYLDVVTLWLELA